MRRVLAAALLLASLGGCASSLRVVDPDWLDRRFVPAESFEYRPEVLINYEEEGEGARCAVFLHGFASSIRNWDSVRPLLALDDTRRIFLDLKGFGFSGRPRDTDYSPAAQAAIVASFLQRQDLENVTFVGHSYGGAVALLALLTLEDRGESWRVERLVLIDSAAYHDSLPLFVDVLRVPVLGRFATGLLPRTTQVRSMVRKAFHDKSALSHEIYARYEYFYTLPDAGYSIRRTARQIIPDNYRELEIRLQSLSLPVDLVWGEKDRVIPLRTARRLLEDLPDATLHTLDGCGHMPQEECPTDTAELLARVLKKPTVTAPGGSIAFFLRMLGLL